MPPTSAVVVSTVDGGCKAKLTTVQLTGIAATTATAGASIFPSATAGVLDLILPANATFQPPLPTPQDHSAPGLSRAGKIAVGTAVQLGILLFALLILLWRRFHKRKKAKILENQRRQQGQGPPGDQRIGLTDNTYVKAELETEHGAAVTGSDGAAFEKPELDPSSAVARQELAAVKDPSEMDSGQHSYPSELDSIAQSARSRTDIRNTNRYPRALLEVATASTRSKDPAAAPAATTVNRIVDDYGNQHNEPWRWSQPLFAQEVQPVESHPPKTP